MEVCWGRPGDDICTTGAGVCGLICTFVGRVPLVSVCPFRPHTPMSHAGDDFLLPVWRLDILPWIVRDSDVSVTSPPTQWPPTHPSDFVKCNLLSLGSPPFQCRSVQRMNRALTCEKPFGVKATFSKLKMETFTFK